MPEVSLSELVIAAKRGEVVSFPTDTVPALAVLPQYSALIFTLKERSPDRPLILMGASADDLWPYVSGTIQEREIWQEVTQCYWPGQLTLVLPSSEQVPQEINTFDPTTIGIRVPNHLQAREILARTGVLATTSANLSGKSPLLTMREVVTVFPDVWVLDVSEGVVETRYITSVLSSGLPSTVAKWTGDGWQILRQGSIIL